MAESGSIAYSLPSSGSSDGRGARGVVMGIEDLQVGAEERGWVWKNVCLVRYTSGDQYNRSMGVALESRGLENHACCCL